MKTLLVALGILAAFGALFWLDWYYRDTGQGNEGESPETPETDGDEPESESENI
jgi:hypothetical protein